MAKHIFVTGGVVSSLGKGLTAASVALLLQRRGYRVRLQKMDPYLNVDPGTMSPFQHGEVYVTADGAETDLDLGHYERFTGVPCSKNSNYTTGRIYSSVISREREGGYLGKTVQVIPHITNEIKDAILSLAADDVDIVITEIGGTVGDIESLPFLEAIRQLRQEIGPDNGLFLHITLVPYLAAAGEMKTKPSQQSVGVLRSIGIFPDILVCRCERHMSEEHKQKLALFCNVPRRLVIEEKDVEHSIYEVPLDLAHQELDIFILEKLKLHVNRQNLRDWEKLIKRLVEPSDGEITIAVIGKYISLNDAYKSIYEALTHGGIAHDVKVHVRHVESEDIEKDPACIEQLLKDVQGILVPGGFGYRGIEGKIQAIKFARERGIPFFGICLGMQCAVMEFARNKCDCRSAISTEFETNPEHPVIALMEEQKDITDMGGTMRLGGYDCVIEKDSRAYAAYGTEHISERHRHRYEFNNDYREQMKERGMLLSGLSPDGRLVEIIELPDHPWFVACQFHPEFQSTALDGHPLFKDFIKAAKNKRS
ncbi:MAG: CTP synthase [Spartobacteria bacterium]|nr:CTP synthase [Spartobacteria bacterium]